MCAELRAPPTVERRAAVHAALGDPLRLAIIDALLLSDRSPTELASRFGISSNLLAHHIDVLIGVGLVTRMTSYGDRRRRYIRLVPDPLLELMPHCTRHVGRVVFICTANSARSQFARAMWCTQRTDIPATSGGTQPAAQVHPRARRAARRASLDLHDAVPQPIPALRDDDLVVTVCDRAHEELRTSGERTVLHWSVPDPVDDGDFDGALAHVCQRVENLSRHVAPAHIPTPTDRQDDHPSHKGDQ